MQVFIYIQPAAKMKKVLLCISPHLLARTSQLFVHALSTSTIYTTVNISSGTKTQTLSFDKLFTGKKKKAKLWQPFKNLSREKWWSLCVAMFLTRKISFQNAHLQYEKRWSLSLLSHFPFCSTPRPYRLRQSSDTYESSYLETITLPSYLSSGLNTFVYSK